MGNAGRVLMIPKGEYNSATTYEMLDFVYYQGRSYVCKQTSTGNVPTNTTYWQALTGDASAEIQALTNKLEDETKARAALGAHNILPNIATSKTGITINDDKSITINGIFSSTSYCNLDFLTPENRSFNVSECKGISLIASISETEITGVHVFFGYFKTDNTYVNGTDVTTKSNIIYPSDAAYGRTFLEVRAGTYDNVTIYPMIRLATDSDPTYQPYAKTNVELTHLIKKKSATVTTSASGNASIATDLVPYSAQILAINVTSGAENGAIAVAYKNLGASANGLHVWAVNGTSLASTQIGIEVIYIDGADVT